MKGERDDLGLGHGQDLAGFGLSWLGFRVGDGYVERGDVQEGNGHHFTVLPKV